MILVTKFLLKFMRDRKLSNVIFVLKRKIIQTVHEGKKDLKCGICDKSYTKVHEDSS